MRQIRHGISRTVLIVVIVAVVIMIGALATLTVKPTTTSISQITTSVEDTSTPYSNATTTSTSPTSLTASSLSTTTSVSTQNQCPITGTESNYTGTFILISNGQVCNLKSGYYVYTTFQTYGPVELSGTFTTNGVPVKVYALSQTDLSSYKTSGTVNGYQCTLGSVTSGSMNCETPAGDWNILFINAGIQTSVITFTSNMSASYVTYAEQAPLDLLSAGATWSLSPNYYQYQSLNAYGSTLISGAFSSSGNVIGYVMDSAEFQNYTATNQVTSYYCTTGTVTNLPIACFVPSGEWYVILINPSSHSTIEVDWTTGLTAYGLGETSNLPLYDEQFGLTFTGSFTSLAYDVNATAQFDPSGTGPAYLLNGLTNQGYWYQVGLSYNWPTGTGLVNNGFMINYNVFGPDGSILWPSNGAGGVIPLNGPVNPGDHVRLELYFSNGNVVMYGYDLNTSASASTTYNAEGATEFVGSPSSSVSSSGFFTGLMTEWYHVEPWYGGGFLASYIAYGAVNSPAWLWVDEFFYCQGCGGGKITTFLNNTNGPVNPNPSYQFLSNGATLMYTSDGDFSTGVG